MLPLPQRRRRHASAAAAAAARILLTLLISLTLSISVCGGFEQLWLEVKRPQDVAFSYKIRPAKDFGALQSYSFRDIKMVMADPPDACTQVLRNGLAIKNQVVLIVRGGCSFVSKAVNAEMYGAAAAIISDNELDSTSWIDMIGDGTKRESLISIPVYYLRGRDGQKIKDSVHRSGKSFAKVNIPVNYTNQAIVLTQPPWDRW